MNKQRNNKEKETEIINKDNEKLNKREPLVYSRARRAVQKKKKKRLRQYPHYSLPFYCRVNIVLEINGGMDDSVVDFVVSFSLQ